MSLSLFNCIQHWTERQNGWTMNIAPNTDVMSCRNTIFECTAHPNEFHSVDFVVFVACLFVCLTMLNSVIFSFKTTTTNELCTMNQVTMGCSWTSLFSSFFFSFLFFSRIHPFAVTINKKRKLVTTKYLLNMGNWKCEMGVECVGIIQRFSYLFSASTLVLSRSFFV